MWLRRKFFDHHVNFRMLANSMSMNDISPHTSNIALASLIFGILSWCVLPVIGAITAVILGHYARAEIRRALPGELDGDGLAIAGLILGWLHLGLIVLAFCIIVIFFGGLAVLLATVGH